MNHNNWDIVKKMLEKFLSPFVYGRHLQIVIDLSNFNNEENRRYQMENYISNKTPLGVVNEAQQISLKIRNKISKTKQVDNLLYDLEYEFNIGCMTDNERLYLGRCVQFLLDTDRKKFNYELLSLLSPNKIIKIAHKVKNKLLVKKCGPYIIDCGCYNNCTEHKDGKCSWTPWNKRCDCDNRKCWFFKEPLESIDKTYPNGHLGYC